MSAATEEAAPAAASHDAAAPAAGGGKSAMMKVVVIVVVVMLLEGAGLYFVLGKSGGHAAAEHEGDDAHAAHGASDAHGGGHGGGHSSHAPESDTAEVILETVMTTNNKAAPGSIIHMTFRLVCIVATAQKAAFERAANEEHRHRVRETVLKVARSANMEDLSDPDLSTLKRLLREEINKVLRKSYVIEVVVSDYKTIEQ